MAVGRSLQVYPVAGVVPIAKAAGARVVIIAFLGALDDPAFDRTVPERVPSGLRVGGRLQP